MKKILKSIISLSLAGMMVFAVAGCNAGGKAEAAASDFTYDDGISESGSYNTKYFYRNDNLVQWFADPGCIYVSEEEDPEYGGYFYIYGTTRKSDNALLGVRTKDFASYENLGPVIMLSEDDWARGDIWAPEVIVNPNPANENEKYLMYFSANSLAATGDVSYDNFHLALACAPTPAGPFVLYEKLHNGEENSYKETYSNLIPSIDFTKHAGEIQDGIIDVLPYEGYNGGVYMSSEAIDKGVWALIDASAFFDENGDEYLYFVGHADSYKSNGVIYGVKMKDIATPDYSTLRPLAVAGRKIISKDSNGNYKATGSVASIDSGVNEGPFLQYHYTERNGVKTKKYYLTYSNPGYGDSRYSVDVAVSDAPLGDFDKIGDLTGRPMSGIGEEGWKHISGAGHHSIATAGNEMFIVYHTHAARSSSYPNPRAIDADRVYWQYNEELGYDIYHTNGPTWSLQPVPEVTSGLKNIAGEASVSATNVKQGSKKAYLTDKFVPTHAYSDNIEFRANGSTVITLTFLEDYKVSSIFVYNSRQYDYAFDKLAKVTLYNGNVKYVMNNVMFNKDYVEEKPDENRYFVYPSSAAVMAFEPITCNKITIEINSKLSKANNEIGVGDVYVYGEVA